MIFNRVGFIGFTVIYSQFIVNRIKPIECVGTEIACFVDKINRKDTSSVYPYGTRSLEVNEWLRLYTGQNPFSYKYVILDDFNDFLIMQQEHVIITNPNFGITKEDVVKALEILL